MAERRKYGKKSCKYTEMKVDFIDYKNTELLKISMSERGKIINFYHSVLLVLASFHLFL